MLTLENIDNILKKSFKRYINEEKYNYGYDCREGGCI